MKYVKKYTSVSNATNDEGILSPFVCSIDMPGENKPMSLGLKGDNPNESLQIYINEETGKPDIKPVPVVTDSVITYISTYALQNFNSNCFNAPVKSHEYDSNTNTGIITFDGILTEIGNNNGYIATNDDVIRDFTIPKTVTYWKDDTVFSSGKWSGSLSIHVTQLDDTIVTYSATRGGIVTIGFYLNNGNYVRIKISECLAKDTPITLANKSTKLIQDITYNDELLVWDFDNAEYSTAKPLWIKKMETTNEYWLCKFSNGSELKMVGPYAHRVFNYTDQIFAYPQDCVGKEIYTEDGLTTLVSCELVNESIEFYNIITDYHMNLFANHILTSCRYNNIYPIENMKFVKNDRELVSFETYNVPEKYYIGMRLGEQSIDIKETIKYVDRLINNAIEHKID